MSMLYTIYKASELYSLNVHNSSNIYPDCMLVSWSGPSLIDHII